jgi:tetratricopeptide (TPR) repeat protein
MAFSAQPDLARLENSPPDLLRWQKARQHLLARQPTAALPLYRHLTEHFPGLPHLWFEYGTAAGNDLDFALAVQALARAELLAVADAPLLLLIGQQYHRLRQSDRARACFQRAVAADPSSIHARLSWAAWLERARRLPEAWQQTEECLRLNSRDDRALYYRAFLLHRQEQRHEAENLLRDLAAKEPRDPDVKVSCLHLLGVVLDELGNYGEAMTWLLRAKAAQRQAADVAALEQSYDKADFRRRKLLAQLTPPLIRQWREAGPVLPFRHKLALLGGHPRSGTTLLEQILGAHPSIRAFDESEAFVTEVSDRLTPPSPAPALTAGALDALSSGRRSEFRARYLKSLLRETEGDPAADLLLDKNPSPTASLHLWLRVFPESKIIIALRDPRDVVISCFFQNLALTPMNANFLSLDRAIKHYSDLMDVWLRLRDLGGFEWIESRYEDVVAGLEAEGRRVTEFLGLTWHPAQARFHEAARDKLVFAPTYNEVTQAVHPRAVGRWRHYAAALEPFQEPLARYLRAFGYDANSY